MDSAPPIFSGIKVWNYEGTFTEGPTVAFRQNLPLPSNVSMLAVRIDTEDGN